MTVINQSSSLSKFNKEVIDSFSKDVRKITRSLGLPPKYNMDIDIQYANDYVPGYGRVYTRNILSTPTILSICPGSVTMFPNFGKKDKAEFHKNLTDYVKNADNWGVLYKMNNTKNKGSSGKMYDFRPDTENFAKRLNVLCRASAILMGVGDEVMPGTGIKLKYFDYAYWKTPIEYTYKPKPKDRSIWTDFWNNGVLKSAQGVIDDSNYVHFFVNNSETSASESVETSTSSPGILGDAAQAFGTVTSNIAYYLGGRGSGVTDGKAYTDAVNEGILKMATNQEWGSTLETMGRSLLNGGQMVVPEMVSGSQYGKSFSASMDFVAPYGDKLAIFLHCQVPVCNVLALSLPEQIGDNMFTFPFLCRVYQPGKWNTELGIISSVEINRGGDENIEWTVDGLATSWNVRLTVTPLISQLMVPNSNHPFLFMKNEGLMEYLGNLCGRDLKVNTVKDKADLFATFVYRRVRDVPTSVGRRIGDAITDKLGGWLKLTR